MWPIDHVAIWARSPVWLKLVRGGIAIIHEALSQMRRSFISSSSLPWPRP